MRTDPNRLTRITEPLAVGHRLTLRLRPNEREFLLRRQPLGPDQRQMVTDPRFGLIRNLARLPPLGGFLRIGIIPKK